MAAAAVLNLLPVQVLVTPSLLINGADKLTRQQVVCLKISHDLVGDESFRDFRDDRMSSFKPVDNSSSRGSPPSSQNSFSSGEMIACFSAPLPRR